MCVYLNVCGQEPLNVRMFPDNESVRLRPGVVRSSHTGMTGGYLPFRDWGWKGRGVMVVRRMDGVDRSAQRLELFTQRLNLTGLLKGELTGLLKGVSQQVCSEIRVVYSQAEFDRFTQRCELTGLLKDVS